MSEQAQRHLLHSDMFEDILIGASRPTLVIRRYQELYSQERVEACDAIADTELLNDADILPEMLLDIMKVLKVLILLYHYNSVCVCRWHIRLPSAI